MPDVLTRHPLQPLTISAMQRSKRKTTATQITFEDDGTSQPAKKKTRLDANSAQEKEKANGVSTRRPKPGMCDGVCWMVDWDAMPLVSPGGAL
jgi:hypothetical protein